MRPLDPRDTEFAERIVEALLGLVRACNRDDPEGATAELGQLLTAIMDHRRAMGERAGDEPLRRALAHLE